MKNVHIFYMCAVRNYVKPLYRKPLKVFTSKEAVLINKSIKKIKPNYPTSSSNLISIEKTNFKYEKIADGDQRFGSTVATVKTDNSKFILLEGSRLISEAINAYVKFKTIYFTRTQLLYQLPLVKLNSSVSFLKVKASQMKIWSDLDTPPGIMALCIVPKTIVVSDQSLPITVIVLDIIDDHTLGSILRSLVAANVAKILYMKDRCNIWSSKCLRASAGSHFYIPIIASTPEEISSYIANTSNIYAYATNSRLSVVADYYKLPLNDLDKLNDANQLSFDDNDVKKVKSDDINQLSFYDNNVNKLKSNDANRISFDDLKKLKSFDGNSNQLKSDSRLSFENNKSQSFDDYKSRPHSFVSPPDNNSKINRNKCTKADNNLNGNPNGKTDNYDLMNEKPMEKPNQQTKLNAEHIPHKGKTDNYDIMNGKPMEKPNQQTKLNAEHIPHNMTDNSLKPPTFFIKPNLDQQKAHSTFNTNHILQEHDNTLKSPYITNPKTLAQNTNSIKQLDVSDIRYSGGGACFIIGEGLKEKIDSDAVVFLTGTENYIDVAGVSIAIFRLGKAIREHDGII